MTITELITALEDASDDDEFNANDEIDCLVIYSEDDNRHVISHFNAPIEVRQTEHGVQLWITGGTTPQPINRIVS